MSFAARVCPAFHTHSPLAPSANHPNRLRSLLVVAGVMIAAPSLARAQWSATSLHPLGAVESQAHAGRGQQRVGLVGTATTTFAAIWDSSGLVDLNPAGILGSRCFGMDDSHQVGLAHVAGSARASLWTGTAASWVNLHPVGAFDSICYGVDSNQQVGGVSFTASWGPHAALWNGTAASFVDLSPAGATQSEALAIAGGQQVGNTYMPALGFRASLWTGSAASWVDLTPFFGANAFVNGTDGTQQVGQAAVNGVHRASVWTGTAASWQSLHPIGAAESYAYGVHGGQQVGTATIVGNEHASIWSGTAASWLDLHAFLPVDFSRSRAMSIWHEGTTTYVAGYGYNATLLRFEAMLWVLMPPTSYGAGCPGTGGVVPVVQTIGQPTLGNIGFAMQVNQGLPNSGCLLLGGFAAASIPVGACSVLVAQPSPAFFGPTDANGTFTFGLPIPSNPLLAGLEIYWQGLVLDPLGPLLGFASASGGLQTRIGF